MFLIGCKLHDTGVFYTVIVNEHCDWFYKKKKDVIATLLLNLFRTDSSTAAEPQVYLITLIMATFHSGVPLPGPCHCVTLTHSLAHLFPT